MTVSLITERKLRVAMDHLCNGTSQSTNGQLTISNLAKEAGVSRATNLQTTVTLLAQRIQALTLENERLRTSAARSIGNVMELPHR